MTAPGTALSARILELLAPGRAMTTAELRDTVSGQVSSTRPVVTEDVYRALSRLEQQGARAHVRGRKVYWRLADGGADQKPTPVGGLVRAQHLAAAHWSPRDFDLQECLLRAWINSGMPGEYDDLVACVATELPDGDLSGYVGAPGRTRADVASLIAMAIKTLIEGAA